MLELPWEVLVDEEDVHVESKIRKKPTRTAGVRVGYDKSSLIGL